MKDYSKYITFAGEAASNNKERNDNYRKKGQGEGYLMGRYFNGEIGAIDEEVKRLGLEMNALLAHMGVKPDENTAAGQLKSLIPTGSIITLAHRNIPDGYLECSGALVKRSTYNALYNAIGDTYGSVSLYMNQGQKGTYNGSVDLSYAGGSWKFESQTEGGGVSSLYLFLDPVKKIVYFKMQGELGAQQGEVSFGINSDVFAEQGTEYYTLAKGPEFNIPGRVATINIKKNLEDGRLIFRTFYGTAVNPEVNNGITLRLVKDPDETLNKFHIPDFRGMFLRGFDNGANVDGGRAMGTRQNDAGREISAFVDGILFNCYGDANMGGAISTTWSGSTKIHEDDSWDDPVHNIDFYASRSWGLEHTANEFRPVNMPVVYAIKY